MSEYTIVGLSAVRRVLELVQPFVVFKREHVNRALELISRLDGRLTPEEFLAAAEVVDQFATLNYSKKKHIDSRCVATLLESTGLLVPVTTEAECRDRARLPLGKWQTYRGDHTPAPGNRMKI